MPDTFYYYNCSLYVIDTKIDKEWHDEKGQLIFVYPKQWWISLSGVFLDLPLAGFYTSFPVYLRSAFYKNIIFGADSILN